MPSDRELMQMALDAFESFESATDGLYKGEFAEERKALQERLAQPEPEDGFIVYNRGYEDGIKAEREACAKLVEDMASRIHGYDKHEYAEAIQTRGGSRV